MNAAEQTQAEQQLEQARRSIEHWRQTRGKLGAMPTPLWSEAAAVARRLGAYRVARALGLNYLGLKNRAIAQRRVGFEVRRREREVASTAKHAAFVEVKALPSALTVDPGVVAMSEGVVVEAVAPSGARLTIRLKGGAVGPELAALVASFR